MTSIVFKNSYKVLSYSKLNQEVNELFSGDISLLVVLCSLKWTRSRINNRVSRRDGVCLWQSDKAVSSLHKVVVPVLFCADPSLSRILPPPSLVLLSSSFKLICDYQLGHQYCIVSTTWYNCMSCRLHREHCTVQATSLRFALVAFQLPFLNKPFKLSLGI